MKLRTAVTAVLALTIASCYSPTEFVAPEDDLKIAAGSSVLSFVGSQQAKISYTKKVGGVRTVFFVDFAAAEQKPVQLKKPAGFESKNADSPLISPDGNWVAYSILQGNDPQGVYIQELSADAEPILVDAQGTEPHWWTADDGSLYLIYSDVFLVKNGQLATTEGKTYRRRITLSSSGATIGAADIIAPHPMNGGLSSDGRYLATGYGDAAIYDIQTQQLSLINSGIQVCNPSISPSPANPNLMMFLNFQGTQEELTGSFRDDPAYPADDEGVIPQHSVTFIVDNNNEVKDFIPVSDPYLQLQDPEWSDAPHLVAALGKISDYEADGVLFDISDPANKKMVVFANGLDITSTPSLWTNGASGGESQNTGPLAFTSPAESATYTVGDTVTIAWTVNDASIENVGIRLFLDNGTFEYEGFLERAIPVSEAASYEWIVKADQTGSGCVLKIFDNMDESVYAKSEKFTIQAAQ